jgi:hypothetical protein
MLSFIASVVGFTWKYGSKAINAVVKYIRAHWGDVAKLIASGFSVTAIIDFILGLLGL